MKKILFAAAALSVFAAAPASADVLYSNNFDGTVLTGSGITASGPSTAGTGTATSGSWNAAGWSGTFLRNDSGNNTAGPPVTPTPTSFTFTGLAAHNSITLGGILGFLDSWDGSTPISNVAPDLLEILVDGNVIATLSSNQVQGTGNYGGATVITGPGAQVDERQFYSDVLVNLNTAPFATFAHTGSSLTLAFRAAGAGWQGSTDESWGIDNLSLTYTPLAVGAVPEPATWAMMIGGFGIAGGSLRRRRRDKLALA